ncbi:MAG: small multi-drug export protein [Deltaproteobacteria bacterium]|nr:small multi-drug export protein [Deltaproteobacteria bacterium]
MGDAVLFLKNNLSDNFAVYFLPLYILGGRPVAILSGQMLGFKAFFLLPVVVMLDTLQIPLFYYVFDTISNVRFIKKIHEKAAKKEMRIRKSRLFLWLSLLGAPGVITITMLPLKGCGMWSGVFLSKILKLRKVMSYPLLITGSVLGCLLILGVGEAILKFMEAL